MAATDYDFSLTRSEILQQAFRKVGILGDGQTLTGEQSLQGVTALNMLVKQWQTKDIFLWQIVEQTTTFAVDEKSKLIDNSIIGIDKAWYVDGDNDVPVRIVSYRDYQEIINKETQANTPYVCALGFDQYAPTLYIWPEASGSISFKWLGVLRLQDMDTAGGGADIPQRFELALVYGLACILADDYGILVKERQFLRNEYDRYFFEAQKSDYEYEDITISDPCYID